MDFGLSEEQEAFRQSVAAFAEGEMAPIAAKCDEENVYPVHLLRKMADLGYLGLTFPSEYSGGDGSNMEAAVLFEELAAASAGITLGAYCHTVLTLTTIARLGTDDQKQRYLEPGIRAEKIGAFGMTEAGAGSDVTAISLRAQRDGNDYILNGAKLFTTNSPIADFIVLSVVTDSDAPPGRGISLFIVDKATPGLKVSSPFRTLGMHPAQTAEVVLDGVRVSSQNLLGKENRGLPGVLMALAEGRIVAAAFAIGIARAAFTVARQYATERQQFGQQISHFQVIAHRLANMDTDIRAARLLTYQAAWLADRGRPFVKEASQAKVFATETASRIAAQALHIQGAYGYVMESAAQRYYRDTHVLEIGEGTSEVLRNVIARELGL
ncbi:MAG: acyl-CoA dehydrogenase [Chloroflexi bacterium]|nr:acyl-CoA dehydrogenase [Chloroflexota bacterium]